MNMSPNRGRLVRNACRRRHSRQKRWGLNVAKSRRRINMNVLWWLFLLTTGVSVGGCATFSESECSQRDWYALGYQDGKAGRGDGRMVAHHEACMEHGVSLDLKRYYAGRSKGLREFCTLSRGLFYGRSGAFYQSVCPTKLESGFLTGYRLGRDMYEIEHELHYNVRELDRIEDELARDDIDAGEQRLNEIERHSLESEFRRLEFELQNLEREADKLKDK